MSRVYVGNLDPRVSERDIEDEFRVYGVLRRWDMIEYKLHIVEHPGISLEICMDLYHIADPIAITSIVLFSLMVPFYFAVGKCSYLQNKYHNE